MVYILSALYNLIHENSCNSLSSGNSFPHLQNQRYKQKMVWPMASFTLVPSSFSSTYICEWALNSQDWVTTFCLVFLGWYRMVSPQQSTSVFKLDFIVSCGTLPRHCFFVNKVFSCLRKCCKKEYKFLLAASINIDARVLKIAQETQARTNLNSKPACFWGEL